MNEFDLAQPKRQSFVGIAVIFFKNLRTAINIFISMIAVSYGFQFSLFGFDLVDLAIVISLIFLLVSYFQYRRFFFYVVGDKFIIEKGLFRKDKITIPFDRIQTVNITQNVIQQLLRVVALKIDTAGSAQRELEIAALEGSYARELQTFLVERKEEHQVPAEESKETADAPTRESVNIAASQTPPLVTLSFRQLLFVGLTENHLRTALVIFAVLNGYLWQFEEYLLKPFEPMIEEQANYLLARWLIALPVGLILFFLIAVLISVVRTILRHFNLKFYVDAKGVQLSSGLLRRVEYQVPVSKIQYIKWTSNPLREYIGIKTLTVKKAASEEQRDKQGIHVPGCNPDQINTVLNQFYPERQEGGFYWMRAHKLLFIQLGIWLALVPALLMQGLVWIHWTWGILGLFYLLISVLLVYKYYLRRKIAVNKDLIVLRKGWIFPSYQVFKIGKLQDVSLHQSVFQKRRALATVRFYTAAGDARMVHIPQEEAATLYNYVLYKIETFKGSWM